MLEALSTVVGLAAWGAHAAVPWRLARGEVPARRAWRLAAPALLALGVLAGLGLVAADPDRALAAGFGSLPFGGRLARAAFLSALGVAAADGVLLAAGDRLPASGWRLASIVGAVALASFGWVSEMMRVGEAVPGAPGLLLAAAACRAAVGLAAADLLVAARPLLSPAAGVAAALYTFFLPAPLRAAVLARGDVATLAAAAALLLVAPIVPARLRRPAVALGLLLGGLGLARVAALSAASTVLRV